MEYIRSEHYDIVRNDYGREMVIPSEREWVEVKHGRWVVVDEELNDCDGHRTFYWYECDDCGARPPKNQWGHEWHSNFCPNCGAKMDKE